ncbi:MAG: prolyl oligopeptidase family serine peptidase [Candidatus Eisenbacteria bacterium]|nr:prolyl oligopeptidase family serine peptidase [Candidatus Eisenbacteria bacterium]
MRELPCGAILLVCALTAIGAVGAEDPPVADAEPHPLEMHGVTWTDYYYWMKDVSREDPQTIAYVQAENAYAEAQTAHLEEFEAELYEEMKARIQETDLQVPVRRDDFYYYSRTEEGKDYPIFCRKQGDLDAAEEVTLDVNLLAEGHDFYQVGALLYSPSHRYLAFSADTTGAEKDVLRIKDLATGEMLPDEIHPVTSAVWSEDERVIFYTREVDPDVESPYQLYRHRLGSPQSEDQLLFEEPDVAFGLYVDKTRSREYILLVAGDNNTSEVRYLPAASPYEEFRMVAPRETDVEYQVAHRGGEFFILTNADGATNFKIVRAPVAAPGRENWRDWIPHREAVYLTGSDLFRNWMVVHERQDGLEKLRVIDMRSGQEHYVGFPEPTYAFFAGGNPEFDAAVYRLTYLSLVTPRSIYDYHMDTRELELRKQTKVLGDFDPAEYESERIFAMARDGARVPISLVYREDLFRRDGRNPLFLTAYGAYGIDMVPYFSTTRLSLLDRGFVYAQAHIRGGSEMGERWHHQGRRLKKKNTFRDFIDCAEHLIAEGYTESDRLVINGGSAGGMLMGVVTNLRPDLFAVVVAEVPATDEFTHMLDPTLPGVEFHYGEWGDPRDREQFLYMRSWDAYQNIRRQPYPDMLVTAGLHDPRVPYWEPAKYVAKLRAMKTDDNLLLLKTEMAGHMGASGRYDYLREIAFQYAFILDRLGMIS